MTRQAQLEALLDPVERKAQAALTRAQKRVRALAAKRAQREREALHARYAEVGVLLDAAGLLWWETAVLEKAFVRIAEEVRTAGGEDV